MILIWGTKPTDRKLGFVAETCPSCMSVTSIEVHRIGLTGHFYWVPIGKGQFIDAYGKCTTCNSKYSIELTDYNEICNKPDGTIEKLIQLTNPKLNKNEKSLQKEFERFSGLETFFSLWAIFKRKCI